MNLTISLSKEEKEMVLIGLNMRRNLIETGDPHLSARDAQRIGNKTKVLSIAQMRLIVATDDLVNRLYNSESGVTAASELPPPPPV